MGAARGRKTSRGTAICPLTGRLLSSHTTSAGSGGGPSAGERGPHGGAFPCYPQFCVRNRSDPKTTERDAKPVSVFIVTTCGFQQREYWGLSQMASLGGGKAWTIEG